MARIDKLMNELDNLPNLSPNDLILVYDVSTPPNQVATKYTEVSNITSLISINPYNLNIAGDNNVIEPVNSGSVMSFLGGDGVVTSLSGNVLLISTDLDTSSGLQIAANKLSTKHATAMWNASQLRGRNISTNNPSDGDSLIWDASLNTWLYAQTVAGRQVLTSDRYYYVSKLGSNSNSGLDSSNSFLTVQKAIDEAASLDLTIYNVYINIADGTYTENIVLKAPLGSGRIIIRGNLTTPSNVFLDGSITVTNCRSYSLEGFKIRQQTTPTYQYSNIYVQAQSYLQIGNVVFEGAANIIIHCTNSSVVEFTGPFTVSGSALDRGFIAYSCSSIDFKDSNTVTWQNTPSFNNGLIGSYGNSYIRWYITSYIGGRGGGPPSVVGSGGIAEIIGTAP